jgi:hypothetical protein
MRHRLLILGSFGAAVLAVGAHSALGGSDAPAKVVLGERMGINEGVSVPKRLIERDQLGLEEINSLLLEDAAAVRGTGATWVRLHSSNHPFTSQMRFAGFEAMDQWVQAVQSEDLHAVVVLSPWSGTATALETDSYVVPDEQAWQAWVRAFVERYDFDGEQDMPGLTEAIRHWEVDNEPDLKNSLAPRGSSIDPESFCTIAQYGRVLDLTAAAVRAADPSAQVLNGGIYRPHRPHGEAWLKALVEGHGDAIDIVNVHSYPDDLGPFFRGVDTAVALAEGRPVWVTETSVSSQEGEARQAEMLEAMVTGAFERGVERLFWHTLGDPPEHARRRVGMSQNALYHFGLQPKLAAQSWTRLATGAP